MQDGKADVSGLLAALIERRVNSDRGCRAQYCVLHPACGVSSAKALARASAAHRCPAPADADLLFAAGEYLLFSGDFGFGFNPAKLGREYIEWAVQLNPPVVKVHCCLALL
jgi:hypothetical protein